VLDYSSAGSRHVAWACSAFSSAAGTPFHPPQPPAPSRGLPGRRAGLTLLPPDTSPPQSPATFAHRARSEKMPLANLCNRHCCQLRAPCEPFDSRATNSRPHDPHDLCAPRSRISPARNRSRSALACGSRSAVARTGAGSQPAFANSYPGLESRSGWCRRRELCPGPDVPVPTHRGG
jgi:hypothetical protein